VTAKCLRRSLILALLATALTGPLAFAQDADLLVTKSGPAQAPAGSDVTYTVTITNLGPDASGPVTLNDPIPAGMTFVSKAADPPGITCSAPAPDSGGTITCSAATLAAFQATTPARRTCRPRRRSPRSRRSPSRSSAWRSSWRGSSCYACDGRPSLPDPGTRRRGT